MWRATWQTWCVAWQVTQTLVMVMVIMCASVSCADPSRHNGRGSKWWAVFHMSSDDDVHHAHASSSSSHALAHLPSSSSSSSLSSVNSPAGAVSNSLRAGRMSAAPRTTSSFSSIRRPALLGLYGQLHKKQRRLVRSNDGVLRAVSEAAVAAVRQCQHQFRRHRWNCPTQTAVATGRRLFGRIVNRACKETSFVYAMMSAAVTHSVARACARGSIETCSCGLPPSDTSPPADWQWGGCSDNSRFGYRFSRRFVDVGESGSDLRHVINRHNNEAGRKVVVSSFHRQCKCHGLSGSCTVKTCWQQLSSIESVGDMIKQRFDQATRVEAISDDSGAPTLHDGHPRKHNQNRRRQSRFVNQQLLRPANHSRRRAGSRQLVYREDSPDFCHKNLRLGYSGTQGRLCNNTSQGADGCEHLCCGRGYHTEARQVQRRCECSFKWCCEVECKVCRSTVYEHRCL